MRMEPASRVLSSLKVDRDLGGLNQGVNDDAASWKNHARAAIVAYASISYQSYLGMKSDSLGHSAIRITTDMYSHVFDDSRRGVAEKVGEAVSRARRQA